MKGKQTKSFSKANIYGRGFSLQSLLLYITSQHSSLTRISFPSIERMNSAGTHHVSRLVCTPPVLFSAVLNGSPEASRLSRTDGKRSPRANLSPKRLVFKSSPCHDFVPMWPVLAQSTLLVAQSREFMLGEFQSWVIHTLISIFPSLSQEGQFLPWWWVTLCSIICKPQSYTRP